MLNRSIANSLIAIVPNRFPATVTLTPDYTATDVNVFNAWFKPMNVRLSQYGSVNLQGDETLIKIPDNELNPAQNGREIRPRDTITVGSDVYNVISARLMSVRTVWECVVRKEGL